MGVPFRFHLAMTDPEFRRFIGGGDGPQWICRRTVIWAKSLVRVESQAAEGNAMPEPTRDRPSRNYEFLFYSANSQTIISIEAPLTFRHGRVVAMEFALTLVLSGRPTVRSSPTPSTMAGMGCGELTPKHPHTDTLRCGLVHWSGRC